MTNLHPLAVVMPLFIIFFAYILAVTKLIKELDSTGNYSTFKLILLSITLIGLFYIIKDK